MKFHLLLHTEHVFNFIRVLALAYDRKYDENVNFSVRYWDGLLWRHKKGEIPSVDGTIEEKGFLPFNEPFHHFQHYLVFSLFRCEENYFFKSVHLMAKTMERKWSRRWTPLGRFKFLMLNPLTINDITIPIVIGHHHYFHRNEEWERVRWTFQHHMREMVVKYPK